MMKDNYYNYYEVGTGQNFVKYWWRKAKQVSEN